MPPTKKTSRSSVAVAAPKPERVAPPAPSGWTVKDKIIAVQVVALTLCAFAVGLLYGKVSVYEKNGSANTGGVAAGDSAQVAAPAPAAEPVTMDQVKSLFDKGNIVEGNADRDLLFVEFSDPSCPWCHVAGGKNDVLAKEVLGTRFEGYVAAVPEMKKLVDQGKASFAWYYRNGHGNGQLAAQLLYCAHDVGQFWPVHDILMTNEGYTLINEVVKNDVAKLPDLMKLVASVPQSAAMEACVQSGKYSSRIAEDVATGDALGAGGTPHFLVNTTVFEGAQSFTDMQSAVDAAL